MHVAELPQRLRAGGVGRRSLSSQLFGAGGEVEFALDVDVFLDRAAGRTRADRAPEVDMGNVFLSRRAAP
jgi:hypothetical protein